MAKRFTDTAIWHDEWFRNLPTKYKELWRYLYENCDIAGSWKINLPHLHFSLPGELFTLADMLEAFNIDKERIILFDNNKRLFIAGFIKFQYGDLSTKCGPHLGVMKLFKDLCERGLPKGYLTLQDKDKDKDKDLSLEEREKPFFKPPSKPAANQKYPKPNCEVCNKSGGYLPSGLQCWCWEVPRRKVNYGR
jgi:hypothetical protein